MLATPAVFHGFSTWLCRYARALGTTEENGNVAAEAGLILARLGESLKPLASATKLPYRAVREAWEWYEAAAEDLIDLLVSAPVESPARSSHIDTATEALRALIVAEHGFGCFDSADGPSAVVALTYLMQGRVQAAMRTLEDLPSGEFALGADALEMGVSGDSECVLLMAAGLIARDLAMRGRCERLLRTRNVSVARLHAILETTLDRAERPVVDGEGDRGLAVLLTVADAVSSRRGLDKWSPKDAPPEERLDLLFGWAFEKLEEHLNPHGSVDPRFGLTNVVAHLEAVNQPPPGSVELSTNYLKLRLLRALAVAAKGEEYNSAFRDAVEDIDRARREDRIKVHRSLRCRCPTLSTGREASIS